METRPERPEAERPSRPWVTRSDAVAVTVLALIFVVSVAAILLRRHTVGDEIRVVPAEGTTGKYLVDLNRAGASELELLPGIGPRRAERIIEWRQERGPFRTLDDVKKATGLSARQLDALRDVVTLGEPEDAVSGGAGPAME